MADRVAKTENTKYKITGSETGGGNRQMTFSTKPVEKDARQREVQLRKHREERKRVIRPTTSLRLKKYVSKQ